MIKRLVIKNIRNIKSVEIKDLSQVNVFFGSNGSGKTSVLEAIHILGLARTFKGAQIKPVINYESKDCLVFGEVRPKKTLDSRSIGVTRDRKGRFDARVSGRVVSRVSELAREVPLLVVSSDSFSILGGGPGSRRQFLDWGLFHVEHRFFAEWKRFQRALKQRNILLRHGNIDVAELRVWSSELAEAGERVTAFREGFSKKLSLAFASALEGLVGAEASFPAVELDYFRGWPDKKKDACLLRVLEEELQADVDRGFTRMGPHRSDLRVSVSGYSAAEVLSRGQQKLVVLALLLAQGAMLKQEKGVESIYLLDDLPSELDDVHLKRVCSYIERLNAQVFITAVDKDSVLSVWDSISEQKVFHVEHGMITSVE